MSWFDTVCRYAAHYCSSVCSRNDSPDNRDNRFFIYSTRSRSMSSITHVSHRGRVLGVLRTVREQMERGSIFRRKFASNTKYEAAPTQNGATCFSAPNVELIWESEIPIGIVSGINRKGVFCNISKKYGRRRNLAVCSLSNGCRNSDAKPW